MKRDEAFELVDRELKRAEEKFSPLASRHEGFAVLLEEVDELKDTIWHNKCDESVEEEATQVAAMAIRFMVDLLRSKKY